VVSVQAAHNKHIRRAWTYQEHQCFSARKDLSVFRNSGALQGPSVLLPWKYLEPHSTQTQCELLMSEVQGQLAASNVYRPSKGSAKLVCLNMVFTSENDTRNFFIV